jgi:hypothetical protein
MRSSRKAAEHAEYASCRMVVGSMRGSTTARIMARCGSRECLYWRLADVSGGVGDAGIRGGTGHGLASLEGQLMTQSEHGALQLEPKDPTLIIVSVSQG